MLFFENTKIFWLTLMALVPSAYQLIKLKKTTVKRKTLNAQKRFNEYFFEKQLSTKSFVKGGS